MEKEWMKDLTGLEKLHPNELLMARKIVMEEVWKDREAFKAATKRIETLYFEKTGRWPQEYKRFGRMK